MKHKKIIFDFWEEYYIEKETEMHLCMLCGNTGFIKLENVSAPNGTKLKDKLTFCICPNGLAYREKLKNKI